MFALPALCSRTVKHLHHWVREIAYHDMSRQASDWIPEELRINNESKPSQPISLDFGVPKKHRLNWIQRTIQHLPH